MALFIVRHQHDAEHCPATDPYLGATLLNYLSRPNVRKYGIDIDGEAIVRGEHTMYMIAGSIDEERVRECMGAFATAGKVDVYAGRTCARVVCSAGCGAAGTAIAGARRAVGFGRRQDGGMDRGGPGGGVGAGGCRARRPRGGVSRNRQRDGGWA